MKAATKSNHSYSCESFLSPRVNLVNLDRNCGWQLWSKDIYYLPTLAAAGWDRWNSLEFRWLHHSLWERRFPLAFSPYEKYNESHCDSFKRDAATNANWEYLDTRGSRRVRCILTTRVTQERVLSSTILACLFGQAVLLVLAWMMQPPRYVWIYASDVSSEPIVCLIGPLCWTVA